MKSNLCIGVKEAAATLGLSHWTIRKYVKDGRIKAIRIGRRVLIEPSELQRLIDAGRSGEGR